MKKQSPLAMIMLPSIPVLIQRCRALAALDLILMPEWEYRYYSFNSQWAEGEMMGSMRDGSGDEWWVVFSEDGWAAMKGLGHESVAWRKHVEKLSTALQNGLPEGLRGFATEPAFRWDETSFAYYREAGAEAWVCVNDEMRYAKVETDAERLLRHLVGGPEEYTRFAAVYYERELDVRVVAEVFEMKPMTEAMVVGLNPAAVMGEIEEEMFGEIGYPRGGG